MAVNGEIFVGYMKRERKEAYVRHYKQNGRLKDQIDKLKKEHKEYDRVIQHHKDENSDLREDVSTLDI